jgi:hypothetical protein
MWMTMLVGAPRCCLVEDLHAGFQGQVQGEGPGAYAEQLLGMGIKRIAITIDMSMEKSIIQIAAKYGVPYSAPVKTPMEVGCANTLPMDHSKESALPYLELLGEVMWVVRSCRPDALFAANVVLSRYTNCYTELHFKALKRVQWSVVKYLYSTKHMYLTFRKQSYFDPAKIRFSVYTDTDWGGDRLTRRFDCDW